MDDDTGQAGGGELAEEQGPQVFAVSRGEGGKFGFSRRSFLEFAAAMAAGTAISGCGPDEDPAQIGPQALAPNGEGVRVTVHSSSAELRGGPGQEYPLVGTASAGDTFNVLRTNGDGDWHEVKVGYQETAWIEQSAVLVRVFVPMVARGEVPPTPTERPTATPTPKPQGTPYTPPTPGTTRAEFTVAGTKYTLPCGSPLPAGAVCVCNCVTAPTACSCNSVCTCDSVCTCVGNHYWYPN